FHRIATERILGAGRKHHRPGARRPEFCMGEMRERRRFRQNNVRIGAAETKRVYASQAFTIHFRQRLDRRRNTQLQFLEIDVWIRRVEMEARWNFVVLEYKHRFQKSRDAGGGLEMSDVGFYRADGEGIGAVPAQSFRQSMSFDWVTDRRTGAVRLDECNLVRQYASIFARFFYQPGLRLRAGQEDTVRTAVLIDRRAENYSQNWIAIRNDYVKAR